MLPALVSGTKLTFAQMELYVFLYRYMPLCVLSILTLKHMNISVIVPLESAV